MTLKRNDIAILIPTLNEEKAISSLVKESSKITSNVLIIDGLSTDKTIEKAIESGAKVLYCYEKGKGKALVYGFKKILENPEIKYISYFDGDNTYDPSDVLLLVNKLESEKKCDMIIGNRFPKRKKGSISFVNMLGNILFSLIVSLLLRKRVKDTQSGLRVLNRKFTEFCVNSLNAVGFEIETEMIIKALKNGFNIIEEPINYYNRDGNTKLHPIKDGFKIIKEIFKNLWFFELIIQKVHFPSISTIKEKNKKQKRNMSSKWKRDSMSKKKNINSLPLSVKYLKFPIIRLLGRNFLKYNKKLSINQC